MNAEIICVGTELLLGNIVNTNAAYISTVLAELGFNVYNQSVVGDNHDRLFGEISAAAKRSELIVLSGGLGPTADDITKQVAAEALGLELHMDNEILNTIEQYFARSGRVMPKENAVQALVPENATVLQNDVGTAPGFIMTDGSCRVVLLPGPPNEMKAMLDRYAVPILKTLASGTIYSKNIKLCGIGESEAAAKLSSLLDGKNPTVATYAKPSEVLVRVTAKAETETEARAMTEKTANEVTSLLGDFVYSENGEELGEAVIRLLSQKCLKLSTAESCTAGLVSKTLTDFSGASEVFELGIVAYSNRIKSEILGVPNEILEKHTAISPETAAFMARGAKKLSGADIALGITGNAGPNPSEGKPVGLVYAALTDGKQLWVRRITHGKQNDRDKIRINATKIALDMVRRFAAAYPEAPTGGTPLDGELCEITSAGEMQLPHNK